MEVIENLGSVHESLFWQRVAAISAPKLSFFKGSLSDPCRLMFAFTRIGLDSDTLRLLGSIGLTNFVAQPLVDFVNILRKELKRERTSERTAKRRRVSNSGDLSNENQKSMQRRSGSHAKLSSGQGDPKNASLPERPLTDATNQNDFPADSGKDYNCIKDVDLMMQFPSSDLLSLVRTSIEHAKHVKVQINDQFYISVWASNAASAVRPNQVKDVMEAIVRIFTSGRSPRSMNLVETEELEQLRDVVVTWARDYLELSTTEKQNHENRHDTKSISAVTQSHGDDRLKTNGLSPQSNVRTDTQEPQRSGAVSRGKKPAPALSSNFNELPDYSPPLSTLPRSSTCLLVEFRNQSPLNLSHDPHRHLLHIAEIELCSRLRFSCAEYLYLKRAIFIDVVKSYSIGMEYKKTFVRKRLYWNTIKAGEIWIAFQQVGWFQPKHFVDSVKAYRSSLPEVDKPQKNAPNQGITLQKLVASNHQRSSDMRPNNLQTLTAVKRELMSQLEKNPLVASALNILNVEISRNQDIAAKVNEIKRLTASQQQGQRNRSNQSTSTNITASWLADHLTPTITSDHGVDRSTIRPFQNGAFQTNTLVEPYEGDESESSEHDDVPSDISYEPRSKKTRRRASHAPGHYKCTICNIGFSLDSSLARHYQSVRHEAKVNRMAATATQNDSMVLPPRPSIKRDKTLNSSSHRPKPHHFGIPTKRKASPNPPRAAHVQNEMFDNVIDLAAGGESSPDYATEDTREDLYTHLSKWTQAPYEGSFGTNQTMSNDSQPQEYECPLCGSLFAAKHQLEGHYSSRHPSQKLLECPQQCGKFSATEDNLDAHIMMHWQ